MQTKLAVGIVAAFLASVVPVSAQQTTATTSQPQATTLLAQSATALTGSVTISDVTLTGNAQSIAGSDESRTVAVVPGADGTMSLRNKDKL
jgi:hypothetical protein